MGWSGKLNAWAWRKHVKIIEDKRDRKNGYSLGVKDYYAQALDEFGKMGDFVGGATGSNSITTARSISGLENRTIETFDGEETFTLSIGNSEYLAFAY